MFVTWLIFWVVQVLKRNRFLYILHVDFWSFVLVCTKNKQTISQLGINSFFKKEKKNTFVLPYILLCAIIWSSHKPNLLFLGFPLMSLSIWRYFQEMHASAGCRKQTVSQRWCQQKAFNNFLLVESLLASRDWSRNRLVFMENIVCFFISLQALAPYPTQVVKLSLLGIDTRASRLTASHFSCDSNWWKTNWKQKKNKNHTFCIAKDIFSRWRAQ